VTVDLAWRDGKLQTAVLHGGEHAGPAVPVIYGGRRAVVDLQPGQRVTIAPGDLR
jgi:hypothetical protein